MNFLCRRQLVGITSCVIGIAMLASACTADKATRPVAQASRSDTDTPLRLTATERGNLSVAFAFAREQAMRGLQRREAADRVAAAFMDVAARVETGDRVGAERALAAARGAIDAYRRHATDDGGASNADLEALGLTLDRATAIVRESGAPTSTTSSTTSSPER